MKYHLNQIVQTTSSAWIKPRRVGKIIKLDEDDDIAPYCVEFLDGENHWYSESELRPYKKKSERVKPSTREEEKTYDWQKRLNELGFNHPPLHQFIKNLLKRKNLLLCEDEWCVANKTTGYRHYVQNPLCMYFNPEHRREV